MTLQITPSARVIASHVRYPLRTQDRTLYELFTEHGRYFSAAAPEVTDASGAPITLPAELAPGSIVRVAARAGQMHAIQVIEARYDVTRRPNEDDTDGDAAQEIAVLRAELRTAESDLAFERNLREAAENQAARLTEENERLREEIEPLKGPFDPWQPVVEKFLTDNPDEFRHPSLVILRDALGIPEREHESAGFRRLARVMRRVGGWRDSLIPYRDGRVRGWRKPRYG